MNCEDPYLAEGFLHNLCLCFDIVVAQLKVITRIRNEFVETVAVAERDLMRNSYKKSSNKRSSRSAYTSPKIRWWKNVSKKGKKLFILYLQFCQFDSLNEMAGKTEPFSEKKLS